MGFNFGGAGQGAMSGASAGAALGPWGAAAGGLLGGAMGGFMDQEDPYGEAAKYYNQIPGTISPYFNPYINAGREALPQLQKQYGQMMGQYGGVQNQYNSLMNDPSGMYNKLAGGYQKSPGFDWQMGQGMNAANNAAASGGMQGSPQHQQQAATMAEGLANQDFQNYMTRMMGLYNTGLQGNTNIMNTGISGMSNINQMGYNASDSLAGALANNLMNQGNMAFSGAAAHNQQQGQGMGDFMGGLGTVASFL